MPVSRRYQLQQQTINMGLDGAQPIEKQAEMSKTCPHKRWDNYKAEMTHFQRSEKNLDYSYRRGYG